MKKILTLYVEEQLIQDGKAKGLNLSRFLESKLREFVEGNGFALEKQNSGIHQSIPAFTKHKRDYEKWLISQELSYDYIKGLVNALTGFIREDISDIADNITDTQSIAARNYLNYLSQKSLLSDEQMARFKKKLPLRQSKAVNYIPTNDEVVSAY